MKADLDSIIQYIVEHFPFDTENFPSLEKLSEQDKFLFAVQHCALHFAKTAGKVVASSEATDHGVELAVNDLKTNLAKSLITTLRLAALLNMNADELLALVEKNFSHA